MNKIKNTKGITLIALVITIIILLILAGVTIGTLKNSNIFANAEKAANKYNEEAEKENEILDYIDKLFGDKESIKQKVEDAIKDSYDNDGNLDYDKLKENLDKIPGVENVPEKITDLPITIIVDGKEVEISKGPDGKPIVTVKDNNPGNVGDNKQIKWEKQADKIIGTSSEGTVTLQIGDYINYNALSNGQKTHTPDISKGVGKTAVKNNATGKYDLTTGEYKTENLRWKVMGVNNKGQLEIISERQTTDQLILTGESAYLNLVSENNYVGTLDKFCDDLYGKGTYAISARSLTEEDIKKLVNLQINESNGKVGQEWQYRYPTESEVSETRNMQSSKDNGTSWYNITASNLQTFHIPGETQTLGVNNPGLKKIVNNKYEGSIPTSQKEGQMLYSSSQCALASRSIYCKEEEVFFGVKFISITSVGDMTLYHSCGENGINRFSVRPVITLSSDIKIGEKIDGVWQLK